MEKRWRRGGGGCHGDEYGVGEEGHELDEDEEMGNGTCLRRWTIIY